MTGARRMGTGDRPGGPVRALLAAVAFLTRVPVGGASFGAGDIARGTPAFPVVGAAIGAAVGGVALGLGVVLAPLLAAVLAVGVSVLLTGAMHFDALGDTADGLGGRSREDVLRIMRDHSLGAYGVTAIILVVMAMTGALAELIHGGAVVRVAIAAGAISRATPVVLAALIPNARGGSGAGAAVVVGIPRAAVAACLALVISVLACGVWGLVLVASGALVAALAGRVTSVRLGGVTGDTLGAGVLLTEVGVLIVGAALGGRLG